MRGHTPTQGHGEGTYSHTPTHRDVVGGTDFGVCSTLVRAKHDGVGSLVVEALLQVGRDYIKPPIGKRTYSHYTHTQYRQPTVTGTTTLKCDAAEGIPGQCHKPTILYAMFGCKANLTADFSCKLPKSPIGTSLCQRGYLDNNSNKPVSAH